MLKVCSYTAVKAVERLVEHVVMPAFVPSMYIRFEALQVSNALALRFTDAVRAEITHLGACLNFCVNGSDFS